MSTFLVDTSDNRTLRALILAGTAATWQSAGERDGHPAYRIPSQSGNEPVVATTEGCSCQDSRQGFKCKHRRAVELYLALCEAQRVLDADAHRRGRLRAV